jgi:hypothetical protein
MARKQVALALGLWVSIALLPGCNSNQSANPEQPGASQSAASGSSAASQPAAQQTVTVPAGTMIPVRLASAISSGSAQSGGDFEGTLAAALVVHGVQVAPAGSKVTGKVVDAVSSGRLSRPAELSLTLTSLTPEGGSETEISTSTWSMKGKSHKKRDAELIGGGAGVGALIGALAGHGKGAAIGAAVGAGAGTAGAAATGKKEIELPAETKLDFRLESSVTLPVSH